MFLGRTLYSHSASLHPGPSCSKGAWHYPADSLVCFANTFPLDSVVHPLNNRGQVYKWVPANLMLGPANPAVD